MGGIILVTLILLATTILIAVVVILGLWLSGTTSIVFPGLGIIVAIPLALAFLIVLEGIIVILAAYQLRRSLA